MERNILAPELLIEELSPQQDQSNTLKSYLLTLLLGLGVLLAKNLIERLSYF